MSNMELFSVWYHRGLLLWSTFVLLILMNVNEHGAALTKARGCRAEAHQDGRCVRPLWGLRQHILYLPLEKKNPTIWLWFSHGDWSVGQITFWTSGHWTSPCKWVVSFQNNNCSSLLEQASRGRPKLCRCMCEVSASGQPPGGSVLRIITAITA